MYIIAGLGNPGRQYEGTRHNIGFDIVDGLAGKHNIKIKDLKHKGIMGKGSIYGHKVFLVKPLTFMNLSGECIAEVINYYKVNEKIELIVIADDISLEPGQIRMRSKGSDGGHNGLKNIIKHFGHDEFIRMKIGVGNQPAGYDLAGYVLGHFDASESRLMKECINNAIAAVECILEDGIDKAMNLYNRKIMPEK
ncbi:MAG: aminoacyl-tRNA hydrolase [Lachnospiraceae bacterium]|jgi:PTH1 family peptidyl-tRNA hydrolase|nr:aminoacyl-tRNA hydrolase [Lachnospiraceae bacterium]